jgi:hypothetical protein
LLDAHVLVVPGREEEQFGQWLTANTHLHVFDSIPNECPALPQHVHYYRKEPEWQSVYNR